MRRTLDTHPAMLRAVAGMPGTEELVVGLESLRRRCLAWLHHEIACFQQAPRR